MSEPQKIPSRPLALFDDYSRREVHDIFAPSTDFTPGAGLWGLQGIIEHKASRPKSLNSRTERKTGSASVKSESATRWSVTHVSTYGSACSARFRRGRRHIGCTGRDAGGVYGEAEDRSETDSHGDI